MKLGASKPEPSLSHEVGHRSKSEGSTSLGNQYLAQLDYGNFETTLSLEMVEALREWVENSGQGKGE
jgi:hypothetical protein